MKKLLLLLATVFVAEFLTAQITITGTISDDTGEELIGATIIAKDIEGVGAATDIDGGFSLDIPHVPITLVASYIGYADETILVTNLDSLAIILGGYFDCKSTEVICCFCCLGPSRDLKIGPSHDFINQSSGLTARLQLPYLLSINPKLYIDGVWNLSNDVNDLRLRIERYDMPRIGRIGTSVVGKYRRVDTQDDINLNLKIIGAQFDYRGFELMLGYATQKAYGLPIDSSGAKNIRNDSSIDQTNGLHMELSKTIFKVFFQSEVTLLKGSNQYETSLEYAIPRSRTTVKASLGNINGYQSGILGAMYRLGL